MHNCNQNKKLTCYPAGRRNSDLLLKWANDPDVRAASGNRSIIEKAEHEKWFDRILKDPKSQIVMVQRGDEIVGTVRVLYIDACHEISWTVAPDFRNCGIGREMVAMVTAGLAGPLRAIVERSNTASIKVALAAGFVLQEEKDGVLYYRRC